MLSMHSGGANGCMGGVNNGVRSENGVLIGVIHEKFCVDTDEDKLITDMIVCRGNDLTERKQLLLDNGDAIIVLPGGVGTFDEFWETVSAKSLGMKGLENKPICVINADGFFDGFIMNLQRAYDDGLLYLKPDEYYNVVETPQEAINWCAMHEISELDDKKKATGASSSSRIVERKVVSHKLELGFNTFTALLAGSFITGVLLSSHTSRRLVALIRLQ